MLLVKIGAGLVLVSSLSLVVLDPFVLPFYLARSLDHPVEALHAPRTSDVVLRPETDNGEIGTWYSVYPFLL